MRSLTRIQAVTGTNRYVTRARDVAQQHSVRLLRMSLGVIFLWFGALKFTHSSPVARLVADTLPFLPAGIVVPLLAGLEVVIGIGLLSGRWIPLVAAVMILHLAGTFLVLVTQPGAAFQHGNPLMLTMTGEFVVKNLILISAGLVLVAASTAVPTPTAAVADLDAATDIEAPVSSL